MHFISLLRQGKFEGISSGILQGHYNNPIILLRNHGYAQYPNNSSSLQRAVLNLNREDVGIPYKLDSSWQLD